MPEIHSIRNPDTERKKKIITSTTLSKAVILISPYFYLTTWPLSVNSHFLPLPVQVVCWHLLSEPSQSSSTIRRKIEPASELGQTQLHSRHSVTKAVLSSSGSWAPATPWEQLQRKAEDLGSARLAPARIAWTVSSRVRKPLTIVRIHTGPCSWATHPWGLLLILSALSGSTVPSCVSLWAIQFIV